MANVLEHERRSVVKNENQLLGQTLRREYLTIHYSNGPRDVFWLLARARAPLPSTPFTVRLFSLRKKFVINGDTRGTWLDVFESPVSTVLECSIVLRGFVCRTIGVRFRWLC